MHRSAIREVLLGFIIFLVASAIFSSNLSFPRGLAKTTGYQISSGDRMQTLSTGHPLPG
jgi:hypothetical protein